MVFLLGFASQYKCLRAVSIVVFIREGESAKIMIDSAINHIANQLNQNLKRSFDLHEDIVVISNILEQDGSVVADVNNKVVISLVNIEKETVPLRHSATASTFQNRTVVNSPPLYFNLYLLVSACFSGSNYPEALKFISNTISYFQGQPSFDHQSTPDLDRRIDRLVLDIENMSFQELSNLWGMVSGRYLPSILYKVRMVAFDSGSVREQVSRLREPGTSLNP